MHLKDYLKEKAGLVDDALERLLPGEEVFPQALHRAMRYSLLSGGKRLRPVLVLASSEAVGGEPRKALEVACAFECIHAYSLIHDDLPAIDNEELRRGRPTCHRAFDEPTAILAGDALLTLAFGIIADAPLDDSGVIVRVIRELARAAGSMGMIGGQMVDIESEGRDVDFPVLEYIHIHKTGALILAAVRCGAIVAGAGDRELEALTRYGEAAGLAFQIADDLLDVEGTSAETGKSVGHDEKLGKATYPALLGIEESKRRAKELVEKAVEALGGFGERAEPLRAIARYIVERKN